MPKMIEGNLHPDEPWFTLRAQDVTAPCTVQAYANGLRIAAHAIRESYDPDVPDWLAELLEHAQEADYIAAQMIAWQAAHPDLVKLPD